MWCFILCISPTVKGLSANPSTGHDFSDSALVVERNVLQLGPL